MYCIRLLIENIKQQKLTQGEKLEIINFDLEAMQSCNLGVLYLSLSGSLFKTLPKDWVKEPEKSCCFFNMTS